MYSISIHLLRFTATHTRAILKLAFINNAHSYARVCVCVYAYISISMIVPASWRIGVSPTRFRRSVKINMSVCVWLWRSFFAGRMRVRTTTTRVHSVNPRTRASVMFNNDNDVYNSPSCPDDDDVAVTRARPNPTTRRRNGTVYAFFILFIFARGFICSPRHCRRTYLSRETYGRW